jgi:hypothetical protein
LGSIHVRARNRPHANRAHTASPTLVALAEIGQTHRYAAYRFATTLAVVQALIQAADSAKRMLPAKKVAVHCLTRTYLRALLTTTAEASMAIREALEQPSRLNQIGMAERCRIDQITQMYVYHMRTILWR